MSLIERLRARFAHGVNPALINPDGPEAATQLEAMQAEIDALKHDLERSMHRENAYLNDVMRLRASLDQREG